MASYRFSGTLPYRPEDLYRLVADVKQYPQFVPGCKGLEVLSRTPCLIKARTDIGFGGFEGQFNSKVVLKPYKKIEIAYEKGGDLSQLHSGWGFKGNGASGCDVSFFITVEMSSFFYNLLLKGAIESMGSKMVEAFKKRASEKLTPQGALKEENVL